jgi:hypothetical protein
MFARMSRRAAISTWPSASSSAYQARSSSVSTIARCCSGVNCTCLFLPPPAHARTLDFRPNLEARRSAPGWSTGRLCQTGPLRSGWSDLADVGIGALGSGGSRSRLCNPQSEFRVLCWQGFATGGIMDTTTLLIIILVVRRRLVRQRTLVLGGSGGSFCRSRTTSPWLETRAGRALSSDGICARRTQGSPKTAESEFGLGCLAATSDLAAERLA